MLKNILLAVVLYAGTTGVAAQQQQHPQAVFDRANKLLQQGDIQQALTTYKTLENRNDVSGALFLNMGLSYVRIDSMGKAKYYFLKARQFEETKSQAGQALEYVESRFSRQSAVLPTLPWQQAINWIHDHIGATLLLACGILLLNFGVFLYIIPWFVNRPFSYASKIAISLAVIGGLVIALSFYIDYRSQRYQKAVMVTDEASVTEQPEPSATIVNEAFEGYMFTVDRSKSREHRGWSYIRMSNGQYGWIPTKEIMIL